MNDPLYLHEPLEYRVEFPVLGLLVRFATNDRGALEQIEEVFGHWRGTDADRAQTTVTTIRIYVHPGDEGAADARPMFRAPDPMRWIFHSPGSVGLADVERHEGVAWVTRSLLADRARFRVSVLNFLVFIIITIDDRTPVHAAMVGASDSALLLAGPSGAGKSTLAYAASRSGLQVWADDAAYIQLEPRRVWGANPAVLLLPEVAQRFAETSDLPATVFPAGKRKVMVPLYGGLTGRRWASRVGVCILERSDGPVRVTRADGEDVRPLVTHDPSGAGVRFGARLDQAADWLASQRIWRISLSDDPMDAVPIVRELLREVETA